MDWAQMLQPEEEGVLETPSPVASIDADETFLDSLFHYYRKKKLKPSSEDITQMIALGFDRGPEEVNTALKIKYGESLEEVVPRVESPSVDSKAEAEDPLILGKYVAKRRYGLLSALTQPFMTVSDATGSHRFRLEQEYLDLACFVEDTRIGKISAEEIELDGAHVKALALRDDQGKLICRYYEKNVTLLSYERIVELPDRTLVCLATRGAAPNIYSLYMDTTKLRFGLLYREKNSSFNIVADVSLPVCAIAMATFKI